MMPPIRESRKPIKKPPKLPIQLSNEKIMRITPQVTWFEGLERKLNAATIIITPQMTPNSPAIAPKPPTIKVKAAPTKPISTPASITNTPPTRDRTYAALGYDSE